ncbi:unnamed protein product [Caenorhabditis nigoni]
MDASASFFFNIHPVIFFFVFLVSLLLIGFVVDYVMRKYGCCGRPGGCCLPALEAQNDDTGIGGNQERIPLNTFRRSGQN